MLTGIRTMPKADLWWVGIRIVGLALLVRAYTRLPQAIGDVLKVLGSLWCVFSVGPGSTVGGRALFNAYLAGLVQSVTSLVPFALICIVGLLLLRGGAGLGRLCSGSR